jgi:hypothetical protein
VTRVIPFTDLQTNCNYVKCFLTPHPSILIAFMFSTHDFLTNTMETDGKTLWCVNLVPVRLTRLPDPNHNELLHLGVNYPLFTTGTIFNLEWNKKYIMQDENNTGVLIRVIERNVGPVDDVPEQHIRYHHGNLSRTFIRNADMTTLLASLEAFTNI